MDYAFPWPVSDGEWIAFGSAVVTVLFGLVFFFAPAAALRLVGLQPPPGRPDAVGQARAAMAGFPLGLGLCAIVLAQPLIYMALGFAWGFAAFGRIVSMLSDGGDRLRNTLWLAFEAALAIAALGFAFGLLR